MALNRACKLCKAVSSSRNFHAMATMPSAAVMSVAVLPRVAARFQKNRQKFVVQAAGGPVNLPQSVIRSSGVFYCAPMMTWLADAEVENVLTRRVFVWSGAGAAAGFALGMNNAALADVKLTLSNIEAAPVPCPSGQTTVTGGTSFSVRCFKVTGDVKNPTKQSVYNADIFGRVYDAQGEPALDAEENLRIDTLAEVPPGISKVSFQISVSESQAKLGPLQLKNFKATGYLGKVNNRQGSGRIEDIDFSELDEDYVP